MSRVRSIVYLAALVAGTTLAAGCASSPTSPEFGGGSKTTTATPTVTTGTTTQNTTDTTHTCGKEAQGSENRC